MPKVVKHPKTQERSFIFLSQITDEVNLLVFTLIRHGGEVSHLRDSSPLQAGVRNDCFFKGLKSMMDLV